MLHLIAENPVSAAVVGRIAAGDDVILQAGSVWAAFQGHRDNPLLQELLNRGCRVYAMQDALSVSGILDRQLLHGVKPIDYPAFVELTVTNTVIHTWC